MRNSGSLKRHQPSSRPNVRWENREFSVNSSRRKLPLACISDWIWRTEVRISWVA
ncbi:hypothetical protein D3C81_2289180 [compost metagenome]